VSVALRVGGRSEGSTIITLVERQSRLRCSAHVVGAMPSKVSMPVSDLLPANVCAPVVPPPNEMLAGCSVGTCPASDTAFAFGTAPIAVSDKSGVRPVRFDATLPRLEAGSHRRR
jgi:hypothetical protein